MIDCQALREVPGDNPNRARRMVEDAIRLDLARSRGMSWREEEFYRLVLDGHRWEQPDMERVAAGMREINSVEQVDGPVHPSVCGCAACGLVWRIWLQEDQKNNEREALSDQLFSDRGQPFDEVAP